MADYGAAPNPPHVPTGHADTGGAPRVYLEVADDGPGVPEAERELIFKRFHRIVEGNSGRGSGIGLSLVAGIAALHDAAVVAGAGLDGRGFSVRVLFPQPAGLPA